MGETVICGRQLHYSFLHYTGIFDWISFPHCLPPATLTMSMARRSSTKLRCLFLERPFQCGGIDWKVPWQYRQFNNRIWDNYFTVNPRWNGCQSCFKFQNSHIKFGPTAKVFGQKMEKRNFSVDNLKKKLCEEIAVRKFLPKSQRNGTKRLSKIIGFAGESSLVMESRFIYCGKNRKEKYRRENKTIEKYEESRIKKFCMRITENRIYCSLKLWIMWIGRRQSG